MPPDPSKVAAPATATTPSVPVEEAPLRRALAVTLIKTGGSGTTEDAAAVAVELEKMPLAELQQMQRNGTRVVACRGSVTDYLTELKGVAPRGWPPGATWDSVPGLFKPERNEVVIATHPTSDTDPTRRVPPTGEGHGASSLVIHESGHSLDYRTGHLSASDANFKAAYAADAANLPPYLAQGGDAGPEEAFAETLALSVSHGADAAHYPHLMNYWATQDPFTQGHS
jgi:hypothetical protein